MDYSNSKYYKIIDNNYKSFGECIQPLEDHIEWMSSSLGLDYNDFKLNNFISGISIDDIHISDFGLVESEPPSVDCIYSTSNSTFFIEAKEISEQLYNKRIPGKEEFKMDKVSQMKKIISDIKDYNNKYNGSLLKIVKLGVVINPNHTKVLFFDFRVYSKYSGIPVKLLIEIFYTKLTKVLIKKKKDISSWELEVEDYKELYITTTVDEIQSLINKSDLDIFEDIDSDIYFKETNDRYLGKEKPLTVIEFTTIN